MPDLMVNCTPVGMHPNVDATPYDKHHLRPSMVVFDTVYNPGEHAADQGSPQPKLHGRDRRGHVRPPGLPAIQAVHRPGSTGRLDARRAASGPFGPAHGTLTRRERQMNLVLIGYRAPARRPWPNCWPSDLGWPGSTPTTQSKPGRQVDRADLCRRRRAGVSRLGEPESWPTGRARLARCWRWAAGPSCGRRTARRSPGRDASSG